MAITRPFRAATWGALSGWYGGSGDAYPYDYGSDVYYEEGTVHAGDQTIPAEEYTEQAATIAASAPEVAADKMEWLPLGVFALTEDGQASGADPNLFLQLAISKQGVIRCSLNNSATNETQAIEGMLDTKSQRAAWTVEGKTRPIMETGIGNLTTDTGPALVHFADGTTQQCLLVRLEEPTDQK